MEKLALAIEIVDLADTAASEGKPIDIQQEARRLHDGHPEAGSSERQIVETLAQEIKAAAAVTARRGSSRQASRWRTLGWFHAYGAGCQD